MRAFASKVIALNVEELAVWRRAIRAASTASGERSVQRWEGEGGSLTGPSKVQE